MHSEPKLSGSSSAVMTTQLQRPAANAERPYGQDPRAKLMARVESKEARRKLSEQRAYQTINRDECLA